MHSARENFSCRPVRACYVPGAHGEVMKILIRSQYAGRAGLAVMALFALAAGAVLLWSFRLAGRSRGSLRLSGSPILAPAAADFALCRVVLLSLSLWPSSSRSRPRLY